MSDDEGRLFLRVWPRTWSKKQARFRFDVEILPDGQTYIDHNLNLKIPALKKNLIFDGLDIDPQELLKHNQFLDVMELIESDKTYTSKTYASFNEEKTNQLTSFADVIQTEHNAEVDHAKELLDNHKYKEGLNFLEKLERRIWNDSSSIIRYRILANKAVAFSAIGKNEEAGKLFVQAYQFNEEDEKAYVNRAIGHMLLNQDSEARKYANKALEKNPQNAQAYSVLVNTTPEYETLENTINFVPENIRKTTPVAYALAQFSERKQLFEEALYWQSIANSNENKAYSNNPDIIAKEAIIIIKSYQSRTEVMNAIHIPTEDFEKLKKAINQLTISLEEIKNSETIKYRTNWLLYRALAYRLIGELDKAILDTEDLVRIQPENILFKKQLGFMNHVKGNHTRVIEILSDFVGTIEIPEIDLILAGSYFNSGDSEKAKDLLYNLLLRELPQSLKEECYYFLIQIALKNKDYETAKKITLDLRSRNPTNVGHIVQAARVEKFAGNLENAKSLLHEALECIEEHTSYEQILELADGLYSLERYHEAWPLYEKVLDIKTSSSLVSQLIHSYYMSNEFKKALNACQVIPVEKKHPNIIQFELSILEMIGDLDQAEMIAQTYLDVFENDYLIWARLVTIWFRKDETSKIDDFANKKFSVKELDLASGFQVCRILLQREKYEKAISLAYELRRENINDAKAHTYYTRLLLSGSKGLSAYLSNPTVSALGTAINIVSSLGVSSWYVLEDREDINIHIQEISIDEDLGKKLSGKICGEEFTFSEGRVSTVTAKVVEIKNKFTYALHSSMSLLKERFPNENDIEILPFSVKKIHEFVKERQEFVEEIEALYHQSSFPIGTISKVIGRSVIDIWLGLSATERGVNICRGTAEELKSSLDTIKTARAAVALDITSLLTLSELQLYDVWSTFFETIYVSPTTVDILTQGIADASSSETRDFLTIHQDGSDLVKNSVSSNDIERHISSLQKIKDWIKDHCSIVPSRDLLNWPNGKELTENLGSSFLETILIAKERNIPLFSDDLGIRILASSSDIQVKGFWIQPVLMLAQTEGLISEENYHECLLKLIKLKYTHLHLNGKTIHYAAKASDWKIQSVFAMALELIASPQMEITSVVRVVIEFIFDLYQQPILPFQRDQIIIFILDKIHDERDYQKVLPLVRSKIREVFWLVPIYKDQLDRLVSAWELQKVRPIRLNLI